MHSFFTVLLYPLFYSLKYSSGRCCHGNKEYLLKKNEKIKQNNKEAVHFLDHIWTFVTNVVNVYIPSNILQILMNSRYVSSGFCASNPGGKKIAWQLRHHMFMFRSFATWLKSCLIVCTPCLLKVFFWLNRTTYRWWYWFPFLCDFFTSCRRLHWPAFVTHDVGHWSLQVSMVCDTSWEASKASTVHMQFQGFYDLTLFWLYYANTMFVKGFSLSYVATYHGLYWFLFFSDFFLCMLWNTFRCMCCMWHWPLIFTGVYGSHDADWEALKLFKIHMHF